MATTAELLVSLDGNERSPASSFSSGLEPDIAIGQSLERKYRNELFSTLSGSKTVRAELTNRITGAPGSIDEVGGYEKKPIYEELNKIPLRNQLHQMGTHFNELKDRPVIDDKLKKEYLQQLELGQRYI
jgi:hypothetical protein